MHFIFVIKCGIVRERIKIKVQKHKPEVVVANVKRI